MDLGNLVETIVYYLLIGEMTCLDCWDKVRMVSALVCMVTHWIDHTVNHDVRLPNCHDSPSYHVVWILNLKRILSFY